MERSFPVLRPGGRLVTLQAPPPAELAGRYDVTSIFFIVVADREHLRALAELVDAGHLLVTIARTFTLEHGREAYESGGTLDRPPGKTVLVIA